MAAFISSVWALTGSLQSLHLTWPSMKVPMLGGEWKNNVEFGYKSGFNKLPFVFFMEVNIAAIMGGCRISESGVQSSNLCCRGGCMLAPSLPPPHTPVWTDYGCGSSSQVCLKSLKQVRIFPPSSSCLHDQWHIPSTPLPTYAAVPSWSRVRGTPEPLLPCCIQVARGTMLG